MSAFFELVETLQDIKCKECHGLGYQDDGGCGDIFANKWECPKCKGKGIKKAGIQSMLNELNKVKRS